ncbi:hypothetical protein [Streptomyces sp. NPDC004546]|uniref:hypothetical protein n=1 Tax=unclassified Streptomyces TaxID=2593676 RepID=UPI0033B332FC
MGIALASETVEYADTLQSLVEELLTRACREGSSEAHLGLEYFLHDQGRHRDAEALTPPPEPPTPHDPAQVLHDATEGDATALEGLRKAVSRQNEAFHQTRCGSGTRTTGRAGVLTKVALQLVAPAACAS